jgi:hypothetical protein
MFCVKCGSELYPSKTVCPNCRFDNVNNVTPPVAVSSYPLTMPPTQQEPYAEGNILVVPRGAALPANCIKCGAAPQRWLQKKFYWHNPLLYLLILVGLLVYAIVALIVRKQVQLAVPLCEAHDSARKTKIWIGSILLLGCIPLPVALGTYLNTDAAAGIASLLGIVMFFAGAIVLSMAQVLRATYIGDDCAKFKGADQSFLARLKPLASPAMAARAPGM